MLNFLPGYGWFALAGVAAAAGPVIIHLLNRRRFRVIYWGAMDFLREALRRNRRILELRDWILLVLRSVAVLLVGLAISRPFVPADAITAWQVVLPAGIAALVCALAAVAMGSRPAARWATGAAALALVAVCAYAAGDRLWRAGGTAAFDPTQPLHAVIVVDNSLSMGYRTLEGTLLDRAKHRARRLIERLPEGSRATVLPLCGSAAGYSMDPYADKADAEAALDRIELVDRRGGVAHALPLVLDACRRTQDLPAKRVVLLSDQQRINWPLESIREQLDLLPELQVVDVSTPQWDNAWVASVEVQDGLADVQTPATLLARIRYESSDPSQSRRNVPVTLTIDGVEVASRIIERLAPGGGEVEIAFKHQFDLSLEPGEIRFVPARIALGEDNLPQDDARHVAVPVVSSLPVVFVDQYGAEGEDPAKNRYGETVQLRQLLAPAVAGEDRSRQLVQIRHTTIDALDRKLLADARLVVIAGVAHPGSAVPLLRQYVEQGGRLVIAAGGDFEAAAWQDRAWLDGAGILPAPLAGVVGKSLQEEPRGNLPFFIDYDGLQRSAADFYVAGEPEESLRELYRLPMFFKAVRPEVSGELVERVVRSEEQRIRAAAESADAVETALAELERKEIENAFTDADAAQRARLIEQLNDLAPAWLAWQAPAADLGRDDPAQQARDAAPRVLATFSGGAPFLVERRIGRGEVLLVSTSVYSSWNTWPTTTTFFLADRLMRRRIEATLPRRNVSTDQPVQIPLDPNDARGRVVLSRPDGSTQTLSYDALSEHSYGVSIPDVSQRGVYAVMAHELPSGEDAVEVPRWSFPLVVAAAGPAGESQLEPIRRSELDARLGEESHVRWISADAEISLEGASIQGQNLWWWLTSVVLVCLAMEMMILAWPRFRRA